MSIQALNNVTTVTSSTKVANTAKPQAAAKPASESHPVIDTFISATTGARASALVGAIGGGAIGLFSLEAAPALHRGLFTLLGGTAGAAGGAVAGFLGGAVAGAVAETKTGGATAGAITGAVTGVIAGAAVSIKSGKFDLASVAGLSAIGAAMGAIGGYTGTAVKLSQ